MRHGFKCVAQCPIIPQFHYSNVPRTAQDFGLLSLRRYTVSQDY
jgi:hypothetical protein